MLNTRKGFVTQSRTTSFILLALIVLLIIPGCQVVWKARQKARQKAEISAAIRKLESKDDETRIKAAQDLWIYEEKVEEAIPILVEMLADENIYVTGAAVGTLKRIGPVAVPQLIEALNDCHTRTGAAAALQGIGPGAKAAVPALIKVLDDDNESWAPVTFALVAIGVGPDEAASIANLLSDADPEVRISVASTLYRIGQDAKPVLPTIIKALGDSNHIVRLYAAASIGKIHRGSGKVPPELLDLLGDEKPRVRETCAIALGRILPAGEVVALLIEALNDPDERVRVAAAWALGQYGPEAKEAIPPIMKLLDEEDWKTRCRAALALGRFGEDAAIALPKLQEMRDEGDQWTIMAIDKAIAMMEGKYTGDEREYDKLYYTKYMYHGYPH